MTYTREPNTTTKTKSKARPKTSKSKNSTKEKFLGEISGWQSHDGENEPNAINFDDIDYPNSERWTSKTEDPDAEVAEQTAQDSSEAPAKKARTQQNADDEVSVIEADGSETSTPDDGESDEDDQPAKKRQKFTDALHSAWSCSTPVDLEKALRGDMLEAQHPNTLEDRLSKLREKHIDEDPPASVEPHANDEATKEETLNDKTLNNEAQNLDEDISENRVRAISFPHTRAVKPAGFGQEGLQDIVDKLKPEVLGGGPDHLYQDGPRKSAVSFYSVGLGVTAAVGLGIGAFLAYQSIQPSGMDEHKFATRIATPAQRIAPRATRPVPRPPQQLTGLNGRGIAASTPVVRAQIAPIAAPMPALPAPTPVAPPRKLDVAKANKPVVKNQMRFVNEPQPEKVKVRAIVKAPVEARVTTPVKARLGDGGPPVATPPSRIIARETPPAPADSTPPAPSIAMRVQPSSPVRTLPRVSGHIIMPTSANPVRPAPERVQDRTPTPVTQRVARLNPASAVATPPRALAATPRANKVQPPANENDVLVAQADQHLKSGDISAARLLYEHAAQAGHIVAAVKLAETFDPITIDKLNVQGIKPDGLRAAKWYLVAAERGHAKARLQLQILQTWLARVDQFNN